jgi:hypothetical protein
VQIAEDSDDRLVIIHGTAWLLPVFGVLVASLTWGLVFLVSRLGWSNEPASYTLVFLAICVYGLLNTRLTRFTFDKGARVLRWRRIGVIPQSGELPFDTIEKPVLDIRKDRRGTAYYKVLLATARDRALPVVPGRTRDLFACLDVLEGVAGALGQPRMAELVAEGRTAEAVRLAENKYGAPGPQVEAYLERKARRAAVSGPSCAV